MPGKIRTIYLDDEYHRKFLALGGSKWLRRMIDKDAEHVTRLDSVVLEFINKATPLVASNISIKIDSAPPVNQ